MKTQSVSTISGAAIGRWPYILSALGIKVPSAGHHGACPACGGKDRFRLDDKAGRGTWFCNVVEQISGIRGGRRGMP